VWPLQEVLEASERPSPGRQLGSRSLIDEATDAAGGAVHLDPDKLVLENPTGGAFELRPGFCPLALTDHVAPVSGARDIACGEGHLDEAVAPVVPMADNLDREPFPAIVARLDPVPIEIDIPQGGGHDLAPRPCIGVKYHERAVSAGADIEGGHAAELALVSRSGPYGRPELSGCPQGFRVEVRDLYS